MVATITRNYFSVSCMDLGFYKFYLVHNLVYHGLLIASPLHQFLFWIYAYRLELELYAILYIAKQIALMMPRLSCVTMMYDFSKTVD